SSPSWSHPLSSGKEPQMNRRLNVVAAVAAGALLMGGCSSADQEKDGAAPADSSADNSAAEAAADWLLADLNDEGLLEVTTSYEGKTSTSVDHGGSADLVLGLSAITYAPEQAVAITDALADDLETYVGAKGEVYSGPSAKA